MTSLNLNLTPHFISKVLHKASQNQLKTVCLKCVVKEMEAYQSLW